MISSSMTKDPADCLLKRGSKEWGGGEGVLSRKCFQSIFRDLYLLNEKECLKGQ